MHVCTYRAKMTIFPNFLFLPGQDFEPAIAPAIALGSVTTNGDYSLEKRIGFYIKGHFRSLKN